MPEQLGRRSGTEPFQSITTGSQKNYRFGSRRRLLDEANRSKAPSGISKPTLKTGLADSQLIGEGLELYSGFSSGTGMLNNFFLEIFAAFFAGE